VRSFIVNDNCLLTTGNDGVPDPVACQMRGVLHLEPVLALAGAIGQVTDSDRWLEFVCQPLLLPPSAVIIRRLAFGQRLRPVVRHQRRITLFPAQRCTRALR
jgi:hypothetical protein